MKKQILIVSLILHMYVQANDAQVTLEINFGQEAIDLVVNYHNSYLNSCAINGCLLGFGAFLSDAQDTFIMNPKRLHGLMKSVEILRDGYWVKKTYEFHNFVQKYKTYGEPVVENIFEKIAIQLVKDISENLDNWLQLYLPGIIISNDIASDIIQNTTIVKSTRFVYAGWKIYEWCKFLKLFGYSSLLLDGIKKPNSYEAKCLISAYQARI